MWRLRAYNQSNKCKWDANFSGVCWLKVQTDGLQEQMRQYQGKETGREIAEKFVIRDIFIHNESYVSGYRVVCGYDYCSQLWHRPLRTGCSCVQVWLHWRNQCWGCYSLLFIITKSEGNEWSVHNLLVDIVVTHDVIQWSKSPMLVLTRSVPVSHIFDVSVTIVTAAVTQGHPAVMWSIRDTL